MPNQLRCFFVQIVNLKKYFAISIIIRTH